MEKRGWRPSRKGRGTPEIETDKVTTEVESSLNGTLVEIVAEEGDEVEITKTIAWVEVDE